ncbi:alpha/beta hydrolase domain-containing protein [Candidatus Neomarinimicrobiota bacterium]
MTRNPILCGRLYFATLNLIILGIVLMPSMIPAKVVRVEITSREVVTEAAEHGQYDPYEVLKGIIYLEVDPEDAANALVADLKLAGRNERGMVEFSTEFELYKPVEAETASRRLMYFVSNRGGKGHYFNVGLDRDWFHGEGWSYMWCGWGSDVVQSDRRININVPIATDNGEIITGKVYCEMINYEDTAVYSQPLVWGGSIAYQPVDMDDPTAVLTMRKYRWEEPVAIPREQWSFARTKDNQVVADPGYLYVKEGIQPGWLYDLVYTGKDPKVTGLGMAAIRDVVSFLRYEEADEAGTANPLAGVVEHTYAYGHSQSARLLYHFVWQDFNSDERGRIVFDGMIPNCPGGGKGQFNSRFAQSTRHGSHHEDNLYPIDFFPFTTVEQYDPITGKRGDGLGRARASGTIPKMMFINSSTDYWTRAASLLHTDVEGKTDAEIDPNVRIYLVAGRQHVEDRIGILGRALLTALDEWVTEGVEPPESQVPKISDGTLVDLESWKKAFPHIPDMDRGTPPSYYRPYRLDPGPRWASEGIMDYVPPKTGPHYAALVPQVDKDGNELAGIRLPEIAVPLATYAGWTMRPLWYSRTLGRNTGRIWPLASTKKERKREGDPRKSVAERYKTKEDYLAPMTKNLDELRKQRFLLEEDYERMRKQAKLQAELIRDLRSPEDLVLESAEADLAYTEKVISADFLWLFGMHAWEFGSRIRAKGLEYLAAGQLEQALEVLEFNTRMCPNRWEPWDGLAEYYYTLKDYNLAKQYYERSLKVWSGNEHTIEMLARIAEELQEE